MPRIPATRIATRLVVLLAALPVTFALADDEAAKADADRQITELRVEPSEVA